MIYLISTIIYIVMKTLKSIYLVIDHRYMHIISKKWIHMAFARYIATIRLSPTLLPVWHTNFQQAPEAVYSLPPRSKCDVSYPAAERSGPLNECILGKTFGSGKSKRNPWFDIRIYVCICLLEGTFGSAVKN